MQAKPLEINWNPDYPIFAGEPFLKAMGNEYGWLGGFDESGTLRCILPYAIIRKTIFRLVRFPVQTIFLDKELTLAEEKYFLNSAMEHLALKDADLVMPATFNTLFRTFPSGAVVAPYGSYILDLGKSEDALWNKVHSKHRNVIRNAAKKGVKILSGMEHLEKAFQLVSASFNRSSNIIGKIRVSMKLNYENFRTQAESFGTHVKVFVAEYDGVAQGCAVIPFSKECAYYMHGGSIESPVTGAMNLLQWEAIRTFREQGVRYYDFYGGRLNPEKGSKAEGINKFKERFGGQLTEGYMWKYSFRPWKYRLYSLATRIIRSGGDVVDQEGHKLKDTAPIPEKQRPVPDHRPFPEV